MRVGLRNRSVQSVVNIVSHSVATFKKSEELYLAILFVEREYLDFPIVVAGVKNDAEIFLHICTYPRFRVKIAQKSMVSGVKNDSKGRSQA
jgi:hypothetical protein